MEGRPDGPLQPWDLRAALRVGGIASLTFHSCPGPRWCQKAPGCCRLLNCSLAPMAPAACQFGHAGAKCPGSEPRPPEKCSVLSFSRLQLPGRGSGCFETHHEPDRKFLQIQVNMK